MKDQRFTELLNLYLDREISAVEAAELEAEISREPARRRAYQHYCRQQKACAQIFERECAQAPASLALERALRDADRKVAGPETRRGVRPILAAFAGFAAVAACFSLVMLRQTDVAVVKPTVQATLAAVTRPAAPAAQLRLAAADADDFKTVFAVRPAGANDWPDPALATTDHFSGGLKVELPPMEPISSDDLRLVDHAALLPNPAPVLRSHQPMQAGVEFTAFQFQR